VNSFRRGLRDRTPLALVAALALLVPALLGFQWLFTSGVWTAMPLERVLRSDKDSFTFISWTVAKVRRQPPGTPGVYLLGGSSARDSIVSGDALAAEIERLGGPRVAAYDFGSINQDFAQSLAVVDNVPDTPAWLLVGVNLGRFTATREENAEQAEGRDLLLDSSAVRSFVSAKWGLEKRRQTILPGIWAYLTDWARRRGADVLSGSLPSTGYRLHQYSAATRLSDSQKERLVTMWITSRKPVFEHNLEANLQMLDELLAQARERGVHVVLLEQPLNEQVVGDRLAAPQRQYQEPVTALAHKYGVPYVDLNQTVAIPSRDFQDLSHLIGPGRAIWQHALAEELAPLIRTEDAGGSSG
jgi:lysophospholipase L1-like esterase